MSDLVKRLRRKGERIGIPCPDKIEGCLVFHYRIETDADCAEAADRIEALETALQADEQTIKLAFGEMTPRDMRMIKAAFKWALDRAHNQNDKLLSPEESQL